MSKHYEILCTCPHNEAVKLWGQDAKYCPECHHVLRDGDCIEVS